MNPLKNGLYLLLSLLITLSACNDPTSIGAEILEDDQAEIGFDDTLRLTATTIVSDTVQTYSPQSQLRTYLLGNMVDPIFGNAQAELYLQPRLSFLSPDFTSTVVDSLVLVLPYDTTGFYGKTEEMFTVDVFELTEDMDREATYFSDANFMADMMPIGSQTFTPIHPDTLEIVNYSGGLSDTINVLNQLRINLDPLLGTRLIRLDSAAYANDSLFVDAFKGLYIKTSSSNEGMLAFDLFEDAFAGIFVYYTKNDTVPFQYQYQINPFSAKVVNFQKDISGTPVQDAINAADLESEYVYIQGMTGTDAQLELPDLSFLQNAIINKAELEVTVATLGQDKPEFFTPSPQLVLSKLSDDGDKELIEDISLVTLRGLELSRAFGGDPEEGENGQPTTYKMNISAHLQDVINGTEGNTLFISVFPKPQDPTRTVLYGTHPEFGIKLKIAYTNL